MAIYKRGLLCYSVVNNMEGVGTVLHVYYGLEEAVARLGLTGLDDNLIHLSATGVRGSALRYEIIPQRGKFSKGHSLHPIWRATTYIIESTLERGEAWLGYHDGKMYSFLPLDEAGLVYFGKIRLLKETKDKRKVKLPIVEFEDGTVCRTLQDYLDFFSLDNTYINRGKVLTWLNQQSGETKRIRRRRQQYDPDKVLKFTLGTNSFGKPVGVLSYCGLPPLVGFSPIMETFPDMTLQEAKDLYHKYDIPIPSTMEKHFRMSKSKRGSSDMDYDHFIETYHLYPHGDQLNFEGSYGVLSLDSPGQLGAQLRKHGEVITKNQAQDLWNIILGVSE